MFSQVDPNSQTLSICDKFITLTLDIFFIRLQDARHASVLAATSHDTIHHVAHLAPPHRAFMPRVVAGYFLPLLSPPPAPYLLPQSRWSGGGARSPPATLLRHYLRFMR